MLRRQQLEFIFVLNPTKFIEPFLEMHVICELSAQYAIYTRALCQLIVNKALQFDTLYLKNIYL